jgi:hypothetical protein
MAKYGEASELQSLPIYYEPNYNARLRKADEEKREGDEVARRSLSAMIILDSADVSYSQL